MHSNASEPDKFGRRSRHKSSHIQLGRLTTANDTQTPNQAPFRFRQCHKIYMKLTVQPLLFPVMRILLLDFSAVINIA